jgi:hypothetical protein
MHAVRTSFAHVWDYRLCWSPPILAAMIQVLGLGGAAVAQELAVSLLEDRIEISGATPAGEVLVLGMQRHRRAGWTEATQLEEPVLADAAGEAVVAVSDGIAPLSTWVVADLESGEAVALAARGALRGVESSVELAAGRSGLVLARRPAKVLLVRAGVGAWLTEVRPDPVNALLRRGKPPKDLFDEVVDQELLESGEFPPDSPPTVQEVDGPGLGPYRPGDGEGPPLVIPGLALGISELADRPVGGRAPGPPERLEPDDRLIVLDPRNLGVLLARVSDLTARQ